MRPYATRLRLPGRQPHRCRQTTTGITDASAFAEAFARGVEHPRIRAALETAFDPDSKPFPVQVRLSELLGTDGHLYCTGWRLEPMAGSMPEARKLREAWVAAAGGERTPDVREPTARPVETFEGGTAVFVFGHNSKGDGYEVATMYPRPPQHKGPEHRGRAVTGFYWERHPDGPFATLIGVAATYCSPDSDADDYERLKRRARREDDEQMRAFKTELQRALADPGQLPEGELDSAVEYTDENDASFLRRLWRDLYGDEPEPGVW